MRSSIIVLVFACVAAASLHAQVPPIPVGDDVALKVEILDAATRSPLGSRRVVFTVRGPNIESQVIEMTIPASGVLRVPLPAPGKYEITAKVEGFAPKTHSVTVGSAAAQSVTFALGPIPIGGGSSGGASKERREAVEKTFGDDVALLKWLKAEGDKGRVLENVIPVAVQKSIFVMRKDSVARDCVAIASPLTPKGVQDRLELHDSRTLRGAHRLSDTDGRGARRPGIEASTSARTTGER